MRKNTNTIWNKPQPYDNDEQDAKHNVADVTEDVVESMQTGIWMGTVKIVVTDILVTCYVQFLGEKKRPLIMNYYTRSFLSHVQRNKHSMFNHSIIFITVGQKHFFCVSIQNASRKARTVNKHRRLI